MHYEDDPSTKGVNLDNSILPLFRRENFSANLEYAVLEPSLRLASHLLKSTALVPFIITLIDGDVRDPVGRPCFRPSFEYMESQKVLWSVWPRTGMDQINEQTKARAAKILDDLADMVSFELLSSAYADSLGGIEGCSEPLEDSSSAHPSFPGGCKSNVGLSDMEYSKFAQLTQEQTSSADAFNSDMPVSLPLLEARFSVARIYAHEIAHCLLAAGFGYRPREICYKDGPIAEAGYELEVQLFGYLLEVQPIGIFPDWPGYPASCGRVENLIVPSMLLAMDWPTRYMLELDSDRIDLVWAGRPLRSYELAIRVRRIFLVELFTNEFWAKEHNRQDVGPIAIPTTGCFLARRFAKQSSSQSPAGAN